MCLVSGCPVYKGWGARRVGDGWRVQKFTLFPSSTKKSLFFLPLEVFSWNCGRGSRPWTTQYVRLSFSRMISGKSGAGEGTKRANISAVRGFWGRPASRQSSHKMTQRNPNSHFGWVRPHFSISGPPVLRPVVRRAGGPVWDPPVSAQAFSWLGPPAFGAPPPAFGAATLRGTLLRRTAQNFALGSSRGTVAAVQGHGPLHVRVCAPWGRFGALRVGHGLDPRPQFHEKTPEREKRTKYEARETFWPSTHWGHNLLAPTFGAPPFWATPFLTLTFYEKVETISVDSSAVKSFLLEGSREKGREGCTFRPFGPFWDQFKRKNLLFNVFTLLCIVFLRF